MLEFSHKNLATISLACHEYFKERNTIFYQKQMNIYIALIIELCFNVTQMAKVKKKRGNINVCSEGKKAIIRNLKFLLVIYKHSIARNLSKKGVDIASAKVILEM